MLNMNSWRAHWLPLFLVFITLFVLWFLVSFCVMCAHRQQMKTKGAKAAPMRTQRDRQHSAIAVTISMWYIMCIISTYTYVCVYSFFNNASLWLIRFYTEHIVLPCFLCALFYYLRPTVLHCRCPIVVAASTLGHFSHLFGRWFVHVAHVCVCIFFVVHSPASHFPLRPHLCSPPCRPR